MAKQTVDVGTTANDDTGDPIREAFIKVNDNFDEIYSSYIASGSVTVGNTTVNTVISNTGGLRTGNSTVNTVVNSTSVSVGANISLNSSTISLGNSTVNAVHTSSLIKIANSSSTANLTPVSLSIGTTVVNSTAVSVNSATVASNTLNLGSFTSAVNGYSHLPNGFKFNWGWVSANSTVGQVTFTAAYPTNSYIIVATSNSTADTYQAAVVSSNSTKAEIRTSNASSTNVYWMAIGI